MVDDGNIVVHEVLVVLVEIYPFFDDALVIAVKRGAGRIIHARSAKAAGLYVKHAEPATAVRIAPLADRVAVQGWIDVGRPVAAVGENPALSVVSIKQNVSRLGKHHDFHWIEQSHNVGKPAAAADDPARARSAAILVGQACLE
jgi:hypothetical protein